MPVTFKTDDRVSKTEKYEVILPQIKALIAIETDLIANLANICAVLKQVFNFFWVGFYLVKEGQLVLGPFQGSLACTRIDFNTGVCGAAYSQKQTIVVEDVEKFPRHIACSSASKSEIVVPLIYRGRVKLVLDVDSDRLAYFDGTDKKYLEQLTKLICEKSNAYII